jgi:AraC-like DNA-binding protein
MFFKRIAPDPALEHIIECFWIAENTDPNPIKQKIIPDGFTEIIFHFSDPYRIKLGKHWQLQSKNLLAGQIRKHFLLENTGIANILGIKFKPASLAHLYNLDMRQLTDRVIDISILKQPAQLINIVHTCSDYYERIGHLTEYFKNVHGVKSWHQTPVDKAVDLIFKKSGLVTMTEVCEAAGIGERQLENLFKKYIGLGPKFFSRILRFNYIFQLVQGNHQSWTSLAYEAAYYDQSHFIRNFRSFTGESPSTYSFDEKNMANFFLKKPTPVIHRPSTSP